MFLIYRLNMFLSLNFQWILELVHFETLNQFNPSSFEIREFSPFNQILSGLFDVSYAFQDYIWVVYIVWHIFVLMLSQILLWNLLEMSNKLNKIWLKELNLCTSKDEGLNWFKILKWINSKIHWKLMTKTYLTINLFILLLYSLFKICSKIIKY